MFSPIGDPVRAALQARADHFSNLVTWSTIVVAVGVVLEGVEIIHDVVAWRKRKIREKRERVDLEELAEHFPNGEVRGETESHSSHPRWVKRLLRLGLIAVVLGVVGEWRYGVKLEEAHNAIHEYDIAKLTAAEQKAGDAKTSAEGAANAASRAKDVADVAVKEVTALSPRTLSPDQQREIIKRLRVFSRHSTVVGSYGMDGEGAALATQLMAVVGAATGTMPVDKRASAVVSGGFEWGIAIRGPSSERGFMLALQRALTLIGKLDRVSVNGSAPPIGAELSGTAAMSGAATIGGGGGPPVQTPIPASGPVSIWVGIKPPPLLSPLPSKH